MKDEAQFIAYQGTKYTIEWYFDNHEKSIALNYFNELSFVRKKQLRKLLEIMGDIGKIHNIEKFRHEENGIYVFKPKPDRFFCFFFTGSKIIITNAYEKKTDKMSPQEYDKAIRLRKDFEIRYKNGTYYEKKNN